jgi:hypothetical protein
MAVAGELYFTLCKSSYGFAIMTEVANLPTNYDEKSDTVS